MVDGNAVLRRMNLAGSLTTRLPPSSVSPPRSPWRRSVFSRAMLSTLSSASRRLPPTTPRYQRQGLPMLWFAFILHVWHIFFCVRASLSTHPLADGADNVNRCARAVRPGRQRLGWEPRVCWVDCVLVDRGRLLVCTFFSSLIPFNVDSGVRIATDRPWTCVVCTYPNRADDHECELCLTPRGHDGATAGTSSTGGASTLEVGVRVVLRWAGLVCRCPGTARAISVA